MMLAGKVGKIGVPNKRAAKGWRTDGDRSKEGKRSEDADVCGFHVSF